MMSRHFFLSKEKRIVCDLVQRQEKQPGWRKTIEGVAFRANSLREKHPENEETEIQVAYYLESRGKKQPIKNETGIRVAFRLNDRQKRQPENERSGKAIAFPKIKSRLPGFRSRNLLL